MSKKYMSNDVVEEEDNEEITDDDEYGYDDMVFKY